MELSTEQLARLLGSANTIFAICVSEIKIHRKLIRLKCDPLVIVNLRLPRFLRK